MTNSRSRHLKCGEERPRCFRCKFSGRACEGYEIIRIAQTFTNNSGGLSLTWSQPLATILDASANESLAFKYFEYSCASIVHNEFKYRPLFQYILQVAHAEPSVWHATVALGSMQKPMNAADLSMGPTFSFHQYGKAVKKLNQRLSSRANVRSEMVLASSLLLATFEVLQKEFWKGSQHVNGSLNYLCDLVQGGGKDDSIVFSSFVDVFARLKISTSIFGGKQIKLLLDPFERLSTNLEEDCSFSMEVAGYSVLFCPPAMRYLEDPPPFSPQGWLIDGNIDGDYQAQRELLLKYTLFWERAMQRLEPNPQDAYIAYRATLLKIYMRYCKLSVSTLTISEAVWTEMRYDCFNADFLELLHLCKNFMSCGEPETHGGNRLRYPSFTIHVGIIHILWYIAIKCRDPGLRREAVCLLNHCHHGEGDTFDGVMIAGYANMVIRLEEGPDGAECARDVPLERRICKPHFNTIHDDHILHCEKGDFRLGEEWSKWQPICVFSV